MGRDTFVGANLLPLDQYYTDRPAKSRSSKSGRHSSRHENSTYGRNQHSSGQSALGGTRSSLSFLFVVNEVSIANTEADTWGNPRPPTTPGAYYDEIPSAVMRFHDGHDIQMLSPEVAFWERDGDAPGGAIYYINQEGSFSPAETYKTSTVSSCHPLMPFAMVQTDAMIARTCTSDMGFSPDENTWQPLMFFFPLSGNGSLSGRSQAMFRSNLTPSHVGGSLTTYVAGQQPSWIPNLVPRTYQNPLSVTPSRGLGGDLSILLGIMAYTAPRVEGRTRAEGVFCGPSGRWRNRQWHHNHSPAGCKSPRLSATNASFTKFILWVTDNRLSTETPQVLIVTIALDPWNPTGSTFEALEDFELSEVAVMG